MEEQKLTSDLASGSAELMAKRVPCSAIETGKAPASKWVLLIETGKAPASNGVLDGLGESGFCWLVHLGASTSSDEVDGKSMQWKRANATARTALSHMAESMSSTVNVACTAS